ncbi:universal stress protein [Sphingobacterium lumbrici]|uniref:universal stress protein n=1 Tax=Sphingobacterium lumbrici TaxID=2559600 RepID=UPI00112CF742|nr:universal stress protein [Sphingobacterium lumbrici]
MTNKIIIPVDFSEYSQNAIEVGCEIAKQTYHDIDLVHIFTDHTNIYRNSIDTPDLIDPRVGMAKRDMQQVISRIIGKYPQVNINAIFRDGNLYEEIKKLTHSNSYDAIVMGTKGSSGLDALLIGSNMYDVFQNSATPVLAIPLNSKNFKKDKVGLLCNFKEGEIDVLKQAIRVFNTDFELILIHINTDNTPISDIDKKFDSFIPQIIEETGIDNISYVVKNQSFFIQYKENISSAIDSVIADELIDILLVTKSKKGFLRQITSENIVKKMAYQIKIPKFFAKS